MRIKEKEQQLFQRWREKYDYFITDGLLDEDEWNKQRYKILFVLKEANWENANGDLCEFLLSESSASYWKTWNNVARWTKALLEGGDYPRSVSKADKTDWLRKVAIMNLKKVGGNSAAKNNMVYAYAKSDRAYLKKQIALYEPDIIICCGRGKGKNADILHDVIFETHEVSEWQVPILTYNYFYVSINNKKKIPVVSFYHPQMRGGHERFKKRYEEMMYLGNVLKERKR